MKFFGKKRKRIRATNSSRSNYSGNNRLWRDLGRTEYSPLEFLKLYQKDPFAKKGVLVPAGDMTRMWREWDAIGEANPRIADDIEALEKKLKTREIFYKATVSSRLYGGSAVLILNDDPDLSKPIFSDNVLALEVVARGDLIFTPQNNGESQNLGEFLVGNQTGRPLLLNTTAVDPWADSLFCHQLRGLIHSSRLIFLKGIEVPAYSSLNARFNLRYLLGDSVLLSCLEIIDYLGLSIESAARMARNSSFFVYNVEQSNSNEFLNVEIQQEELEDSIKKLGESLDIGVSAILRDPVDIKSASLNMTGMPEIIDLFLKIISGAFSIPQAILFGQDLSGLNTSAVQIVQTYYDNIKSEQERVYSDIGKLDRLLCSAIGASIDDYKAEWVSLWQTDENEETNLRAQEGENILRLYQGGLLTDDEARDNLVASDVVKGLKDEKDLRDFEENFRPKIDQNFMNFDGEK